MGARPTSRPVRVLVVDDDEAVARAIALTLERDGCAVETVHDGAGALRAAVERSPDVVVLDLLLPDLDGVEVCRGLRARGGDVAILMLTAKDAATDQIAGLDAGADDYVVKPCSLNVLAARVRALLRRREPTKGEVYRFEDLALDTASRVARRRERDIHLTTTEYRLLLEFMRNPEQILTRSYLTDRVWRYDFEGDDNVLEVYVRYLRQKLEAAGEPRLIHTLRGAGYVLRAAPP